MTLTPPTTTLTNDSRLVGAVFEDRASARRAADELRTIGVADHELSEAIARDEDRSFGPEPDRSLLRLSAIGALIGLVVGALVGALALTLGWDATATRATTLGAVGGGLLGLVLGAYAGVNRMRIGLWDYRMWSHLEPRRGEVLLVVDARNREDAVIRIIRERDGRPVEPGDVRAEDIHAARMERGSA